MKYSAFCLSSALLFSTFQIHAVETPTTEERLLQMEKRIQQLEAEQAPHSSGSTGQYIPNAGFRVAETEKGSLAIKLFTYVRYLNQRSLNNSYVDSFGVNRPVQQRNDILINKVTIYINGWFLDPKLRYLMYVWTSNTSQGQGAQVVVAGKVNYKFNEHINVGGGTDSLPGVRTTEGNFPFWLGVDERLIADEFFRPSYTMGLWADGSIVKGLTYSSMLGNNLSQLGVDTSQLDNKLATWSNAIVWMPTTGEYGKTKGFGDFEEHQKLATRFGAHYTYSDENYQGQPTDDSFENVQIRLSDGKSIFTPNVFGSGVRVTDADYNMVSVDGGVKFHGISFEAENYWRWINNFRGPGTEILHQMNDTGFQLQASCMAMPKLLQLYTSGSKIFGTHGDPWDARLGANWFPWKSEQMRWNFEYIQLYKSPVGGQSLPYVVGGTGPVFHSNFMISF